MVKISEIGEDDFIERIKKKMASQLHEGVVGIGDDCAVVPLIGGKLMLLSTDSLVEGCHFIKDKISARDLGYKSVMVNVSDIAAMGGRGLYLLMSIAMPKETEEFWIEGYMTGVKEACDEAGVALIGGDTTGSKSGIFINFSIVGEVLSENVKYRKEARKGDLICVTGLLGDSLAGFELMMKGELKGALLEKHIRPRAHFEEGAWLGARNSVRAMMDISDGLVQDLMRMMEASGCGCEVDLGKIPLSKEFCQFAKEQKWAAEEKAVSSGEEYCLLLTVDPTEFETLSKEFEKKFARPLYVVGVVKEDSGVSFFKDGKRVEIESKGYMHFE